MDIVKYRTIKEAWSYFLVAGAAALINFFSRFLYNIYFSFDRSVVLAYVTGMLFNFSFSKTMVFGKSGSGKTIREAAKFIIVAMVGLGTTYAFAKLSLVLFTTMLRSEHHRGSVEASAHIIGMGAGFITNFFGHKYISFGTAAIIKSDCADGSNPQQSPDTGIPNTGIIHEKD